MSHGNSPSLMAKQVENQATRTLRGVNLSLLSASQWSVIEKLIQNLADAKNYAKDYELSETKEEQQENAKRAKNWLNKAQSNILAASQFEVFNAVDVAHLSAQIDQIKADLK